MGRARKAFDNVDELVAALGGIDGRRIKLRPAPGSATEDDVVKRNERKERIFELVDGTLVEKAMGFGEGLLGGDLFFLLKAFVRQHKLGEVGPGDTMMRLMKGLVRVPDVCFISRARLPGGQRPTEPLPTVVPDLVAEVLSESNTPGEMLRKRKEYFLAGVLLVWQVDPRARTVDVFTAPDRRVTLTEDDTLDGGAVLPGFAVGVKELFADVPAAEPKPRRRKR